MSTREPRIGDGKILAFNLLVWAVMLLASIVFIARFGSNVPSWDDWDQVPTATGHQPVTWEWLWSQHNEHRVPLPRLIMLGLMRFVALDFRVQMYFNTVLTGAVALGLLLAARHVRGGRSSMFDAFLPIALMHWGQAANMLWGWQIQFYCSALLGGLILMLVSRLGPKTRAINIAAIGVAMMLLPLCGANGLALVPAMACWLGYAAFLGLRKREPMTPRLAMIAVIFALVSIALVGLYFLGYERVPFHPSTHRVKDILSTSAKFLTMGFGPGIVALDQSLQPAWFWRIACIGTLGLLATTLLMLLHIWRRDPKERLRSAGLICVIGAVVSLALGLGMGREGFESRYITLSVPALCAVYLAWSAYGRERLGRWMRGAMFILALAALPWNTKWGLEYGRNLKQQLAAFEADMISGLPLYQLVHRHANYLHPHHDLPSEYLPMLRNAGVGAFTRMKHNLVFREVSVPLQPVELHEMRWNDGVGQATGYNASVTFALPADVPAAAGVRLRYSYTSPGGIEPYLAIFWKSLSEADFTDAQKHKYSPTGDHANWQQGTWTRLKDNVTTMTVWTCDDVGMVRVSPLYDRGTIRIHALTVLVPADVN